MLRRNWISPMIESNSVLASLRSLSDKLDAIHDSYREKWKTDEQSGGMKCVVDGVDVELKYEGSNRRTDFRTVLVDGFHFATECETIPWSVFKDISVSYTCYIDLQPSVADKFMSKLPAGAYSIFDEYYPPEDGVPCKLLGCNTLEEVVVAWKLWNSKFRKYS